ncbi:MAG: hypothetical protein LBI85_00800 [Spirochaetaceae bacterium]|jgi:hypothetical protein|nr:hypothetical protein [Spirochaetaceae bacterium]
MTGKAFVSAFGSVFVSAFGSAPAVLVFALVFALAVLVVPAGGPLFSQALSGDAPYMIPRNVYVGDQARLVVPLSSAFAPALAGGLGAAELGTAEL